MAKPETEERLAGGNVNASVVRIGDTVRRALGPHSASVHRLLRHLEQKGFSAAPRFLGIDDQRREMTSYIPGSSAFPKDLWLSETLVVEAAKMLRTYHQAVEDFDPGHDEDWAYADPDPAKRELICHNDFAPYNMIFRGGLPVGIVDFDLAGPGPRLRDLAYLAYWLAPLSFSTGEMAARASDELKNGCPRLRLLCRTYGTAEYDELIDQVTKVLAHMADEQAAAHMVGPVAAARLKDGGHFAHWRNEAERFEHKRDAVLRQLQ